MSHKIVLSIITVLIVFVAVVAVVISPDSRVYYASGDITIESINHQTRGAIESKPFSRFEGDALGLDKHLAFSPLDFFGPFSHASAIASGDFNNDNWQDILLADRKGILLYKNSGASSFVLQEIDVPEINNLNIILVAFVDINNDGWQDIYITSYGGKNYFILNDKEGFRNSEVLRVPNKGALVTHAASFIDINKDGYLDFVNGNWFFGSKKSSPSVSATNKLIINNKLQFQEENLKEIVGQTLVTLFSDFTNDNNPDLLIGNDFHEPDIFYAGDAVGNLQEIKKGDNIIPVSTFSTMSIDVADFNNDLYMDIYMGGLIISSNDGENDYCFEIKNISEKQKCQNNLSIKRIIRERDVENCTRLKNSKDKNDCKVMITMILAMEIQNETLCEKIPKNYQLQRLICHNYFAPRIERPNIYKDAVEQRRYENVLLQGTEQGKFQEVSYNTGAYKGLWTWNAKFADLDNDEWQDIYVANGHWGEFAQYSNVFLHSNKGQFFEAEQEQFNLENFNMVTAYTYIDIDNDGDLDIISAGLNGPINVYINNETKNNSITFEFRDYQGNHFGIGNKIYIYYGENNERHQVREIKSGGGFLSFDSPIAHFGLAKYDVVNKIEVVWSTGEKTTIDKEFLANKKYVIERKK